MPFGISEVLMWVFLAAFPFFAIWLMTKYHKAENLKVNFVKPRKEASLAIVYVFTCFLIIAVIFFILYQSAGGPIGTPKEYSLRRALSEWALYAAIFIIPILVIVRARHQIFETVGITRKNMRFSIAVGFVAGIAFSLPVLGLSKTLQDLLEKLFTTNSFYGLVYYLAVGFGEELMFRGFLQLRCCSWLGETKGLIFASTIMALGHLPERIFAVGLDPMQALVSAISLLPISLVLGFLMLKTRNTLGPAILHTMIDWVSVL